MLASQQPPAPRIDYAVWGQLRVHGFGSAKDFKLWPGGGRPWDWRETGTQHVPGIQPADVQELLDHGAETVVLSRGMWRALQTQQATLDRLVGRGVDYRLAETNQAIAIYNELADSGHPVGGLFHSTC